MIGRNHSGMLQGNESVVVSVDFPGRVLYAKVWKVQVGCVPVYLMDTDIQENSAVDRIITAKL